VRGRKQVDLGPGHAKPATHLWEVHTSRLALDWSQILCLTEHKQIITSRLLLVEEAPRLKIRIGEITTALTLSSSCVFGEQAKG